LATIDFGEERTINVTARAYRNQSGIHGELIVDTPFDGWKTNRADFQ